jgi:hypothetical protein
VLKAAFSKSLDDENTLTNNNLSDNASGSVRKHYSGNGGIKLTY